MNSYLFNAFWALTLFCNLFYFVAPPFAMGQTHNRRNNNSISLAHAWEKPVVQNKLRRVSRFQSSPSQLHSAFNRNLSPHPSLAGNGWKFRHVIFYLALGLLFVALTGFWTAPMAAAHGVAHFRPERNQRPTPAFVHLQSDNGSSPANITAIRPLSLKIDTDDTGGYFNLRDYFSSFNGIERIELLNPEDLPNWLQWSKSGRFSFPNMREKNDQPFLRHTSHYGPFRLQVFDRNGESAEFNFKVTLTGFSLNSIGAITFTAVFALLSYCCWYCRNVSWLQHQDDPEARGVAVLLDRIRNFLRRVYPFNLYIRQRPEADPLEEIIEEVEGGVEGGFEEDEENEENEGGVEGRFEEDEEDEEVEGRVDGRNLPLAPIQPPLAAFYPGAVAQSH
jgi:hypothetical protein